VTDGGAMVPSEVGTVHASTDAPEGAAGEEQLPEKKNSGGAIAAVRMHV